MTEYPVCATCLTCLVNDDWTALEDDTGALAMAETLGWVTYDRTEDHGVYRCTICSEDHYGPAEIITATTA